MPVTCPKCSSRFLKVSRPRGAKEKLNVFRFVLALRCGDCRTRFTANTLIPGDLKWAKCPRCERMDLNMWTRERFESDWMTRVKMNLGAHLWRCEYCRLNFASFRPRHEVFSFRRWQKLQEKGPTGRGL